MAGFAGSEITLLLDRLPEQLCQLHVACRAGVEAVGADVFGVRGERAALAVKIDQRDAVAGGERRDARVPMLDGLPCLHLFCRVGIGEERQARQIGQICHNQRGVRARVQVVEQSVEIMHVAGIGDAADEVVDREPDGDEVG